VVCNASWIAFVISLPVERARTDAGNRAWYWRAASIDWRSRGKNEAEPISRQAWALYCNSYAA